MTQMSLFTQVKNDPNVIISWGRIDPNGNIYEAWILFVVNMPSGCCLEQMAIWSRMRRPCDHNSIFHSKIQKPKCQHPDKPALPPGAASRTG